MERAGQVLMVQDSDRVSDPRCPGKVDGSVKFPTFTVTENRGSSQVPIVNGGNESMLLIVNVNLKANLITANV